MLKIRYKQKKQGEKVTSYRFFFRIFDRVGQRCRRCEPISTVGETVLPYSKVCTYCHRVLRWRLRRCALLSTNAASRFLSMTDASPLPISSSPRNLTTPSSSIAKATPLSHTFQGSSTRNVVREPANKQPNLHAVLAVWRLEYSI